MRTALVASAVLLALLVAGADRGATGRYDRYVQLVKQHELYPLPAAVDIDADGSSGSIEVEQSDPTDRFALHAVVRDGGRELLRLPYEFTDHTYRTHLAWYWAGERGRLVVFDGTAEPGEHVRRVYSFTGRELTPVAATQSDEELLAALASQDDAGSFHQWLLYKEMRLLGLGVSFLIVPGLAILWARKLKP